jgi:hypothetical protein
MEAHGSDSDPANRAQSTPIGKIRNGPARLATTGRVDDSEPEPPVSSASDLPEDLGSCGIQTRDSLAGLLCPAGLAELIFLLGRIFRQRLVEPKHF